MNLAELFELALLGENAGVNLWKFRTKDLRSLGRALDYPIPFVSGEQKWPHRQIIEYKPEEISPLLVLAWVKFRGLHDRNLARELDPNVLDKIERLCISSAATSMKFGVTGTWVNKG